MLIIIILLLQLLLHPPAPLLLTAAMAGVHQIAIHAQHLRGHDGRNDVLAG
jgi:hypothetical protein